MFPSGVDRHDSDEQRSRCRRYNLLLSRGHRKRRCKGPESRREKQLGGRTTARLSTSLPTTAPSCVESGGERTNDSAGRQLNLRTLRGTASLWEWGRTRFCSEASDALVLKMTYPGRLVIATMFIRSLTSQDARCDQQPPFCLKQPGGCAVCVGWGHVQASHCGPNGRSMSTCRPKVLLCSEAARRSTILPRFKQRLRSEWQLCARLSWAL
ncbi:hypothetical protein B0J12DRAFT_434206 [Macrophomina phaseolina]|uniref:Uncharacterized protein n=1 Tax=Macrophomina phaseolina TaxID=35725 RepID=A0ABQ8GHA6_9PEZI|nr:hypothetical protein B0J12DRAFT_434206 [Macrophomina phaseolina]